MSYDLYLFHRQTGRDDLDVVNELLELEEQQESANPGLPDAAKERRKRELASKLIETGSELSVFETDFVAIANHLGMSLDEARTQHRQIELNGLEDGNGAQITLFDDTASITMPYRQDSSTSQRDWEKVWRYLAILESEGGFATYDGQLERVLNLDSDLPTVVAAYNEVVGMMPSLVAKVLDEKKKPWWKVW